MTGPVRQVTLKSIAAYLGRFLELRARAFVYALFALVGFLLGLIVYHDMALDSIGQLQAATRAAVLKKYGA